MKIIISTLITSAFGIFLYLTVTAPKSLAVLDYSAETSDLSNGEYIFTAAGCSGCHIEEGSKDKYLLAGGQKFETAFGTFKAPNISNSVEFGIGAWEFKDFYNALKLGQSPDGEHYFPTFPYTAYSKMTDQDIMDLWTFWKTLPSSDAFISDHDLPFLFSKISLVLISLIYSPPFILLFTSLTIWFILNIVFIASIWLVDSCLYFMLFTSTKPCAPPYISFCFF